jgi:predicted DNA-binding protein YlxM (UPF0122 family)
MNTPLYGLQKTIVSERQNGISVVELSKKYKVSRQAIYDLLKRAENEGCFIPWVKLEKKPKFCVICNKEFYKKAKTCSKECMKKLMKTVNINKDSKWSRHVILKLKCVLCGKDFERTKYQQAIAVNQIASDIKQDYCSKECYYNRTGCRDLS